MIHTHGADVFKFTLGLDNFPEKTAIRSQHLQSLIVSVTHNQVAGRVEDHVVDVVEQCRAFAVLPELPQKLAVDIEHLQEA